MSFIGAINIMARKSVAEFAAYMQYPALVIGAGNFTVPAALRSGGYLGAVHSCDVSLYSSVLGTYLSDNQPLNLSEKPDAPEHLKGLLDIRSSLYAAASITLLFDLREVWQEKNPYQARILGQYLDRWTSLMSETVAKLEAYRLHVAPISFESRCGFEVLDSRPSDSTVFAFPPTYKRGYERLEKLFTSLISWPAPSYAEMTDKTLSLYEKIASFKSYFVVLEKDLPDVYAILGHPTAIMPRGHGKTYIINKTPGKKWVVKKQLYTLEAGPIYPPDKEPAAGETLSMVKLSLKQTLRLNELYLSHGIDYFEGGVGVSIAFLLAGRIIGKADFCPTNYEWKLDPPGKQIYLMSDLAVPSRIIRLSKLILLALLSSEVKAILNEYYIESFQYVTTTAFSKNPVSMKYRGIFKLHSRKKLPGGYLLNYFAPFGSYLLASSMEIWKKRYE